MTAKECIYGRRSIRKYKPDPVDHALLESGLYFLILLRP